MALEDIIRSIEKETAKELKDLERETSEKVALIDQKTETEKAKILKEIDEAAKKEGQRVISQAEYQLRMKEKNALLEKKQELLKEAFKEALKKLATLDENEYRLIIEKQLKSLGDGSYTIIPAKGRVEVTKAVVSSFENGYQVSEEVIEGIGGYKAVSDSVEIDNTFETLLLNQKEELEVEAAKILFGDKD